jgi:UDP-glucose 4-epimerase
VIYGDGSKRRDFVYVDDVNAFHLLCLRDERTIGNVYNVGSGTSTSVREIFDTIARITGSTLEPIFKPDLSGEAQENRADVSAARALGWEPTIDLSEGLRRSIDYIKLNVPAPALN